VLLPEAQVAAAAGAFLLAEIVQAGVLALQGTPPMLRDQVSGRDSPPALAADASPNPDTDTV
jgi:hypothetical protein